MKTRRKKYLAEAVKSLIRKPKPAYGWPSPSA